MVKWADYCISAVRYDDDHNRITEVMISKDLGDFLDTPLQVFREQVVKSIKEKQETFVTIIQNEKAKYELGQPVHVVPLNGEEYLRTDQNDTAEDNLENLPEF